MENNTYCREYSRTQKRTTVCEQCTRNRFNLNSDCDSDLVKKCRPYRSSATRSRYVNVCAAVCLLLLVGSFSPQSTATPVWTKNMDRQKRSTESQENHLWGNPCDYQTTNIVPISYTPILPQQAANQARNTQKKMEEYKDIFAMKLMSYPTFESMLADWSSDHYQWLRNFTMIKDNDKVFPKAKTLNHQMGSEYIQGFMANIDEILPAMYKGLKVVVAGMNFISNQSYSEIIDEMLRGQLQLSMHECKAVLCQFNQIMRSRNLRIEVLDEEELNKHLDKDSRINAHMIYRDTINYLEYISQVFQTMSESQDVPDHA